jgi:hypothetical protein
MTDKKELNESIDAQASTENRTPRSAETRAKDTARKPWRPPSMLETPPAPEGYSYRWIRAEIVGQEDRKNVTARLREGFDLVRAEELMDLKFPRLTMEGMQVLYPWVVCYWLRYLMKRDKKGTPISKDALKRNKMRLTMI